LSYKPKRSRTYEQPIKHKSLKSKLPRKTVSRKESEKKVRFEIGEYYDYGKPVWVDFPDGQKVCFPQETLEEYKEEGQIEKIERNLREAIKLMKKVSPEFHDVFVDDIKRIVITPGFDPRAMKSTVDPDLLFLSGDEVLYFSTPKQLMGTLGHEEFHALCLHLGKDTKEEEALAMKTEDVLLRKLHSKGLSDDEIRKIIDKYYKDYPSILEKPPVWERLLK